MIGGTINSDGGSDIIEKGICYGNSNSPTLKDSRLIIATAGNEFQSMITVIPGITTYVRAYAINGAGIGYGEVLSYSSIVATIDYIGEITGTSASCSVITQSDQSITSRGVCWSTSANPTINDNKTVAGPGSNPLVVPITGLSPGTKYYVRAYAQGAQGIFYGAELNFITKSFPKVTTKEINNAGTFILTSGGEITDTGGTPVTAAGICWSTHSSPTVADSKTDNYVDYQSNIFLSDLSGLQPNTTYYVRAYAINLVGTAYGNERVITTPAAAMMDADGNPYSSVTIGSQVWTTENLKTTKYNNGETIVNITNQTDWVNATSGTWSYYENDATFNHPYGKLYNWFAVTDARNVCASGWHPPTDSEWVTLIDFLGGTTVAGDKLKESGEAHWVLQNTVANNSSGFTALPGGSRSVDGYVHPIEFIGMYWSSSASDASKGWVYNLFYAIL